VIAPDEVLSLTRVSGKLEPTPAFGSAASIAAMMFAAVSVVTVTAVVLPLNSMKPPASAQQ
jgi:hypothetical protein